MESADAERQVFPRDRGESCRLHELSHFGLGRKAPDRLDQVLIAVVIASYLKCEPGKTAEIKKMIEKTLQETLPESIHPQVTTLQEDIYEAQATENKLKGIILFFSIVSLLITLLGVYSTITLDTERRQKEVAIRKVNGAGLKQIILLFARLYIRLLTVSAVIAFPLIYIVIQMWKKAYIVFFNDGIIYWAGIFIGITFITALTVLFRILRIARINPAEVIKNE